MLLIKLSMEDYPKIYLYKRIVEAKLFIDKHYLENIDIESIAEEACFSKFHFLRLFRQVYGITPHKYLTTLRIEKAKELLQNNISISNTCYHLGFKSINSFTKLFKRYMKVCPLVYSARAKKLRDSIASAPLDHVPSSFVEYLGWNK